MNAEQQKILFEQLTNLRSSLPEKDQEEFIHTLRFIVRSSDARDVCDRWLRTLND